MTASTLLASPADLNSLVHAGQVLVAAEMGLLAIDESIPTCNKRFARLGSLQDERARRADRELILTTPGLGDCISGVILYDEPIRQHTSDGVAFLTVLAQARIVAGIKVDIGAKPMAGHPGEKVTEGLDGLRQRLSEYAAMGARFAKWRAVFTIGERTPSRACVEANAHALARLRRAVPGNRFGAHRGAGGADGRRAHTGSLRPGHRGRAARGLRQHPGGRARGDAAQTQHDPAGFGLPAQDCTDVVAAATLRCLRRAVPAAVAGIAFLSGGQSGDLACTRLAAMNSPALGPLPWPIAFSFGRAIQQPALTIRDGQDANADHAQQALLQRSVANRDVRRGKAATTEAAAVAGRR